MKKHLLTILIVFCFSQMVFPQEDDGVVALDLPIRNSLMFNRYAINPTFSFVREQNKYISITNKREWVQFENAPETFLATYSGRFAENIGAGVALFQQNYGVLTTFGGLLNFAYNVKLNTDKNLTFGLNVGAYKSGINTSNVITNFDDPSLQNVTSNFLLTINPGINYGIEFLDFGISVNNLVLYNFESSLLVEDNPKQGIQAHVMHSGYLNGRGFFSDTKLTAILRSEFRTDETIISGLAMLNVPKGLWLQAGYNSLYGVSGGVGLNITPQFALEYNIEKSIGELVEFGSSHEITLAYRFIPRKEYKYNGDDKVNGLFSNKKKRKRKRKPETAESKAELEGIRARAAERRIQAKLDLEAEKIAKKEAVVQAKLDTEEKAKKEVEAEAKLLAVQKAIEATQVQVKIETDAKMQERTAARAKLLADQKAKEAAEAQTKLLAEQKAKDATEAQAKLLAEQKAKDAIDAQAKLLAEQEAKDATEAQAKLLAEQKAKDVADAQAKLLAEQKAKEAAETQAKLLAEQKAKDATEAQAKLLAEQKTKEAADAQAKLLAEQKAKNAADAKAKSNLLIEQNAIAEAAVLAKLIANEKAKTEAEAQAKLLEEQKAKEEADAQAQLLAEENANEQAKLLAEQKAIEAVNAQAKLLAAEKAKADLISNPKDELGQSMQELAKSTEDSKAIQNELLDKFNNIVGIKDKDLKDLKEENDLSDQGIAVAPRPFKSITAENNALNAIKSDLDDIIKTRSEKIEELKTLYDQRTRIKNTELDEVNLFYKDKIKRLSEEQLKAVQTRAQLDSKLETIRVSTEYEKRRRIKRAAFDSEEDKYSQDRATLKNIKQTTALSKVPLKVEDFDFGEEQGNNIQILKNIKNVESGYYVVIAVHSNIKKRDDFVTKVVASGRTDVDFFYDLNTSKYYIYYDKSDSIENANEAMTSKGDRPYNEKMSIVKIEN